MKRILLFATALVMSLMMQSCLYHMIDSLLDTDDDHDFNANYMELINDTEEPIYFYMTNSPIADKFLRVDIAPDSCGHINGVDAHKKIHIIKPSRERYNYLHLLLFTSSTIDRYTERELAENNIYDKYFVFSADSIEAMGNSWIYTGISDTK